MARKAFDKKEKEGLSGSRILAVWHAAARIRFSQV